MKIRSAKSERKFFLYMCINGWVSFYTYNIGHETLDLIWTLNTLLASLFPTLPVIVISVVLFLSFATNYFRVSYFACFLCILGSFTSSVPPHTIALSLFRFSNGCRCVVATATASSFSPFTCLVLCVWYQAITVSRVGISAYLCLSW